MAITRSSAKKSDDVPKKQTTTKSNGIVKKLKRAVKKFTSRTKKPPQTRFLADMPNEILNEIVEYALINTPRDMNELVAKKGNASAQLTDVSEPYLPTQPKSHPMMQTCKLLREFIMEKYFWTRTFSLKIQRPDPGCAVFKQYLASFEGALPYVRVFKIDVAVVLSPPTDEGRMFLTLINGFLRASINQDIVSDPTGVLSNAEVVRDMAAPWVNALKERISGGSRRD